MTTNQKLYIIQKQYGEDFKIESMETGPEWGTYSYGVCVFIESLVKKNLSEKELKEYKTSADIIRFGSKKFCSWRDSIDDAIHDLFQELYNEGELDD